jgi:hypothetical protein
MAANGISTLATKELRQIAKLDLAATNRAAVGNTRATYDIDLLPTKYDDDAIVDNRKGTATGIVPNPDVSSILNGSFTSLPPAPIPNYAIPGSDVVVNVTWGPNGASYYSPRFDIVNGGTNLVAGSSMATSTQFTVPFVDMGITSGGNWTLWAAFTALQQGRPWVELAAGLYRRTYTGYHNDDPDFFATATQTAAGADSTLAVDTTPTTTSIQWLGYFVPATTETYTFYTSSDDGSYLWIGANAVSGFTTGNALVNNGGSHGVETASGSIALTAGVRYAIRIQTGNGGGPGSHATSFSTPTIAQTTTFTGRIFYNPVVNGF